MATKPASSMPSKNLEAEVRQVIGQFCDAANRRDVDALVACYTQDAVLLPPNQPRCEGREAIRRFVKAMNDAGFSRIEAKADRVAYSGDLVSIVGHNITEMRQPDGTTKIQHGKCLEVRRRQPSGELRLVFHCFNSDEPA